MKKSAIKIALEKIEQEIEVLEIVKMRLIAADASTPVRKPRKGRSKPVDIPRDVGGIRSA